MSKDPDLSKKIFSYIDALDKTNDELLATVKKCVKLLTQFKETVPDPQGVAGNVGSVSRNDKGHTPILCRKRRGIQPQGIKIE